MEKLLDCNFLVRKKVTAFHNRADMHTNCAGIQRVCCSVPVFYRRLHNQVLRLYFHWQKKVGGWPTQVNQVFHSQWSNHLHRWQINRSNCIAGGISWDKQLQNETEICVAGMEETTLAQTGSTFLTLWVSVIFGRIWKFCDKYKVSLAGEHNTNNKDC